MSSNKNTRKTLQSIQAHYPLYLMVLPALLYFALFVYKPMYGIMIAFKDFIVSKLE